MMHPRDAEILEKLKTVIDPDLGEDIVTLGFIKDLHHDDAGRVSFTVELTTPACPIKERFRSDCERLVRELPWVTSVDVIMSAAPRVNALAVRAPGLKGVSSILAVSSCKGGVGKSTCAVNLAYTLSRMGAKVGIFDADVYGPSLPTMVSPALTELYAVADMIQPLDYEGVKLMSFGFVPTGPGGGGAAIMRGPMVTQVINQLLTTTTWGELDYLVIDFPPGTGDIQLTLTQLIPITAAVIVTTPQQLSFVDVVKGIQMFDKLKVPTIAVVENMSYFECGTCKTRHYLFGQGARRKLVEQFGIRNSFEIPILPEISKHSDEGTPAVLADTGGTVAKLYGKIGEAVVREISRLKFGAVEKPRIVYTPGQGIVVTMADGGQRIVKPADLRRKCRCALCVEERSGEALLQPEDVDDNVYPKSMHPMGNYAVAIAWSDGHGSSIYPYEVITEMAKT
ncbi:MAG: P-loop NTPase [bacterium]